MTFETWWLLAIPVFFAMGWIAARVDGRELLSESRKLPSSYFKGLNFLLNEDHDKAIDAFMEVAKLDTETIELHFALGNLFRRRGEIERAIRVHQSLLNRADLPEVDREKALYEIGHDYYKAGMFDTAEAAFKKVLDSQIYQKDAMYALIRIYEAQHDWPHAMEVVRNLQQTFDQEVPQIIHYNCELAEQALRARKPKLQSQALDLIGQADQELQSNPHATAAGRARVLLLKARIAAANDQPGLQRDLLKQVFSATPEFADLAAADLARNFDQAGMAAEGIEFFRDHFAKHASLNVFEHLLRFMYKYHGSRETYAQASAMLHNHPSLLFFNKLIDVELQARDASKDNDASSTDTAAAAADSGSDIEKIQLTKASIQKQASRLDRYVCSECGFQARNFYWQCPGCHLWETYSTQRLEEQ